MKGSLGRLALVALPFAMACNRASTEPVIRSISDFERRIEALRVGAEIPAVSAAIASGGRIVWSKGFGTADLTTGRAATDTTAYHLASLTKTFAATLLMQMVENGQLSLDAPVSDFGITLSSPGVVRVRHLLSHTSSGVPGSTFAYNGDRFGLLDAVISRVSGKTFAELLQERIVVPLQLRHTAPNPQSSSFPVSGFQRTEYERNLARGYSTTGGTPRLTAYPAYFGTAAGLTSTVLDVARFSIALDEGTLLQPATRALAWTPAVSTTGATLPHALGWFATDYRGVRVVWHYGLWTSISALIVKVPDRGLTFVVLANTDALSSPYPLGAGRLETSPWARAFLDAYVVGDAELPSGGVALIFPLPSHGLSAFRHSRNFH
jgi:CubicO group peptidase (beta-lactamase class C family)